MAVRSQEDRDRLLLFVALFAFIAHFPIRLRN